MQEEVKGEASSMASMKELNEFQLNELDLQMFFQEDKKRNKIVLLPSNNIFIKDENNKAKTEISHIKTINISIRVMVGLFLIIIFSVLIT